MPRKMCLTPIAGFGDNLFPLRKILPARAKQASARTDKLLTEIQHCRFSVAVFVLGPKYKKGRKIGEIFRFAEHWVTYHGSPAPVAPSCCHPDPKSWRSWHSLRAPDPTRVRSLRPRPRWASCAGYH